MTDKPMTSEERAVRAAPCECKWKNHPRNIAFPEKATHEDDCPGHSQPAIAAEIRAAMLQEREDIAEWIAADWPRAAQMIRARPQP